MGEKGGQRQRAHSLLSERWVVDPELSSSDFVPGSSRVEGERWQPALSLSSETGAVKLYPAIRSYTTPCSVIVKCGQWQPSQSPAA